MTHKQLKQKLDDFVKLGNQLDAEAKTLYGPSGFLFHEADGGVYVMSGDNINVGVAERQSYVKLASQSNARWGAGAW